MAVYSAVDRIVNQITEMKNEMHTQISGLRNEMQIELRGIKDQISSLDKRVIAIDNRVVAVETKLGMLHEKRSQIQNKFIDYSFKIGYGIVTIVSSCLIIQLFAVIRT